MQPYRFNVIMRKCHIICEVESAQRYLKDKIEAFLGYN
jgi:hypothetical protein